MSEIRDINLSDSGERKIEWVKRNMSLLRGIEEEFINKGHAEGLEKGREETIILTIKKLVNKNMDLNDFIYLIQNKAINRKFK